MKILFSFIAGFLLIQSTQSQSYISIGAGISANQVSDQGNTANFNDLAKVNHSPYLEAKYIHHISNQWAIASGINYNQKGFSVYEGTDINILGLNIPIGVQANAKIHYMDLPLELRYMTGSEQLSFYGMIGPVINAGIKGNIQPVANVLIDFNLPDVPVNFNGDGFQRMGLSGKIGGGALLGLANGDKIGFDLAYQRSFTTAYRAPVIDLGLKNSHVSLGVSFHKKI